MPEDLALLYIFRGYAHCVPASVAVFNQVVTAGTSGQVGLIQKGLKYFRPASSRTRAKVLSGQATLLPSAGT